MKKFASTLSLSVLAVWLPVIQLAAHAEDGKWDSLLADW
jgi:hypothetical protein